MARREQMDTFAKRTAFLTVFLLIVFGLIIVRLFNLQVIRGSQSRALAEDQYSIYRKISPIRGEIKLTDKYSLETLPIAANIEKFLVFIVPEEIKNKQDTAEKLASILDIDAEEVLSKMSNLKRKYVPLKRQITDEEEKNIRQAQLPGVYFDKETVRIYPQGSLLSQTIGFMGYRTDFKEGLYGLERYFEKELAGRQGSLKEEKDTTGTWIFGGKRELTPAIDGVNLVLTIDKNIQFQAEKILKETVVTNVADGGTIIVADPKTGAILALANFPDFNPNEYNKVKDPALFQSLAVIGNYEPGSIFKPITMAAAINEGAVDPDTTYIDEGYVKIDGYIIKNSDNKSHGKQTMTQVLEKSLNTGAIFAKNQIGDKKFLEYVKKFGFGKKTGIELIESKGNLDNLSADIEVNFHTASFGQGISVTPIQIVKAFTAIANKGKMMRPFIVQSKIYPNGEIKNTEPVVERKVISMKTANTISAMMVNVVENGHGKKASVPGYFIAGKTGTAQVSKKNGKGYEEDINIGSFIGFGPAENPKFLILVRIDHPRTVKFAETTAAPAFGKLAQFILNYYGIAPTRSVD